MMRSNKVLDHDCFAYQKQSWSKNVLAEIGEAVKLLPPELLDRYPEIDWRGWAGLRDIVSHQYFNLELPRLRPTIVDEFPCLLAAVSAALAAL